MGMAEFNDGVFGEVTPLPNKEALEKFKELQADAKKLHFGGMDELQRYKDLRESQNRIEEKLDNIIRHFNILHIIRS